MDDIHTCHNECQRPICVAVREAVGAEREKVAEWMMARAYAIGNGETTEELLEELGWQIEEKIAREREACAKWCEAAMTDELDDQAYYVCKNLAAVIRARG